MDETQHTKDDFSSFLVDLYSVKDKHVESLIKYYRKSFKRSQLFHRVFGVLLILTAVSIPFVSSLTEYPDKNLLLSILALIVAGLTGLNAFFQWDLTWREFTQAKVALEQMVAIWDVDMVEARHEQDEAKRRSSCLEATRNLIASANMAYGKTTGAFFKAVKSSSVESHT